MKDTYIRVRCTSEQKRQIKEAAKQDRTNMSDYIITAIYTRLKGESK